MTFFRNKKTAPPLGNLIREEKKESITFKQRQEMFINEETVRDEPENIAPETSITMPRNFVPVFEEEEEKSPTFYYSQQQQQPSSQYRPIRFISFASPNRENGVNAFDYFREKRILSDLKNQTNTLNIADPREDVVEENQAHNVPSLRELKANSSNPSVQKAKKVKLTPVEKNTQNSLTSFGFKVSPSQNLTPSLQYQPQSQSQIQYLQPQSQPIQQRMPQSQPSRQNITFVSLIDEQDDYPQIVNGN